jgi:hypothetical protein
MAVEYSGQHKAKGYFGFMSDFHPALRWQDGAGLVCTFGYSALAWLSLQPEFLSLWIFYALLALSLVATLLVFAYSSNDALTPLRVLVWALCFRVIGILGDPLWESDFFRYLWDGYLFYELGSPYGIAPSEFFGDGSIPEQFRQLLARINYPNVPTIYAPTVEYTFLLGHLIAPAKIWPLQLLYVLADMTLILLLVRFVSLTGVSMRWVLLYAWSPLVVKELAFTAHPDGLGAMLLMVALYGRFRQQFNLAAIALALSVCAKIFALLFVPFVLWRLRLRYWGVFSITLLVLYGPFFLRGASDISGLMVFIREWQFNSSIYGFMVLWLEPLSAKLLLGLGFLVIYVRLFWLHSQNSVWRVPRGDIVLGVFFLVAPVVNAWYLLWLLPFSVLYPSLWSWTFSASVMLSYAIGINLDSTQYDPFELPMWAYFLEYGSVVVACLLELWYKKVYVKRTEKF